ncbi:MAG: pilus assembly FimT family protein [Terrimicrobiaceae bacterium]
MARKEHKAGLTRNTMPDGGENGMSLTEVLVVISFLAIITAVSVPSILGLVTSSSSRTAERNLNYLNGSVIAFNESNWELVLAASGGSDDERAIFDSLRYRAPTNPAPGSPYLPPTATFEASTVSTTYRAKWNGRMFEIVIPGSNGTGLDLMKIMGSSIQANPTNTPVPPAT